MVKTELFPARRGMAFVTLLAIAAAMAVIDAVTGKTISRRFGVTIMRMTPGALGLDVFAG